MACTGWIHESFDANNPEKCLGPVLIGQMFSFSELAMPRTVHRLALASTR